MTTENELYWRYFVPPNPGHTILLLTKGRVPIIGPWRGSLGEYFVAWCPLPSNTLLTHELAALGTSSSITNTHP